MNFVDISRSILRKKRLPIKGIVRRIAIDATNSNCPKEAIISLDLTSDITASLSLCCTYRAEVDDSMKCSLWSQELSDAYIKNHFENDYLVSEHDDCLSEYTGILVEALLQEENIRILSSNATSGEVTILLTYKVLTHSPNHLLTHSPNHLLTHSPKGPAEFQGKMKLFLVQSNVDAAFFNVMRVTYSLSQPDLDVTETRDAIEDSVQPATKKLKTTGKTTKKSTVRGVNMGGSNR